MNYTPQEVLQYIREEDVKFIRLTFCDCLGRQKNISVMPQELERAFRYGISVDASSIAGFGDEVCSDLFLHPDPTTITVLPWRPDSGRVVRMLCAISSPDGTPFPMDSRGILRRAVQDAEAAGVSFAFGTEQEFYLFPLDETGSPSPAPFDQAGYMDVAPEDRGENVRREICLALERMGIQPEGSHHAEGPGQNEINFRYREPLAAADDAITFRSAVRTISAQNGLWADFSPKPLAKAPGNGFHINISVDGGEDQMLLMMAGILARVPEITAFLNPTEQSFRRLGANKAPQYIAWARNNRSALVRIPAAAPENRRVELRSADCEANPYLAFALLIWAGLEGIRGAAAVPEECRLNLYTAREQELAGLKTLPLSRTAAVRAAQESEFLRHHLPQELIDFYCQM